ncbi:GTP cyclohydrolase I FolE2 [Calothrix rhizosoleniae]|uniref:GTP cyclohydrolase I FolE2 n=1 Tax=Calothrix rhizosoleniae TaxID=888997 RepID=UPI000B49CF8D|nr:GTP cyclohydrolase, FolE2/MptA family [Calothrix rhizosoleniae]
MQTMEGFKTTNHIKIDVQGEADNRNIPIQKVGITGVAFRSLIKLGQVELPMQGKASCYVYLPSDKKGTHMSRMAIAISNYQDKLLDYKSLFELCNNLKQVLETDRVYLKLSGEVVRKKLAPVTGIVGYESFNLEFDSRYENDTFTPFLKLGITGTSLCPASKENSEYGAHSQRSRIDLTIPFKEHTDVACFIDLVENNLSSSVYPVLKIVDEKFVTETAYENPKFVEDIVRSIAFALKQENYDFQSVECTNYESIHTHDAYAVIEGR